MSHSLNHLSLSFCLSRMHYSCPKILDNDTYGSCFWDIKTNPHYRQPYEYYYFTLTASNKFGNWTKQIEFHHYSHGKLLVNCHTVYKSLLITPMWTHFMKGTFFCSYMSMTGYHLYFWKIKNVTSEEELAGINLKLMYTLQTYTRIICICRQGVLCVVLKG